MVTKKEIKKRKKILMGIYLLVLTLWIVGGMVFFSNQQTMYDSSLTFQEQFDSNEELQAYLDARGITGEDTTTPKIVFGGGTAVIILIGGMTFASVKQNEKGLKI